MSLERREKKIIWKKERKEKKRKEKKDGYIENENEEGRMKEKNRTAVLRSVTICTFTHQFVIKK
jgi:hypothetical protein